MKKLLMTLGAVLISASCSFAHLGESYAQMANRMGPGTRTPESPKLFIWTPASGEQVWAEFDINLHCVSMTYFFDYQPNPEFVGEVLLTNFGRGIKWERFNIGPEASAWRDANNPKNNAVVSFVNGKYLIQVGNS